MKVGQNCTFFHEKIKLQLQRGLPAHPFYLIPGPTPTCTMRQPLKTQLSHLSHWTNCSHCLTGLQLIWEANSHSSFSAQSWRLLQTAFSGLSRLPWRIPSCTPQATCSHLPQPWYQVTFVHSCVQYHHQTTSSLRQGLCLLLLDS